LAVQATPVVQHLRPTAARLNTFATALNPVSATLDTGTPDLLGFLEGWARAIQVKDGESHVFRNQLNLTSDLVTHILNSLSRDNRSRRVARPVQRLVAVGAPAPGAAQSGAPPPGPAANPLGGVTKLLTTVTKAVAPITNTVKKVAGGVTSVAKGVGPAGAAAAAAAANVSHLLKYLLGP
jgi:hypothetical protein